jgi:hypothetical protein
MRFATIGRVWMLSAFLTLGACTHWVRSLPSTTEFDGQSKDAIIVLKVEPVARVSMTPGTVDRTGWRMSPGVSSYGAWAEEGIIIIKMNPRTGKETYGITVVTPDDGRYDRFHATQGMSLPSFHAVAGQVTFVGAIRIEPVDGADAVSVSHNEAPDDLELVTQLMKRRYPHIRAKVVSEIFETYARKDEPTTNPSLLTAPFHDD